MSGRNTNSCIPYPAKLGGQANPNMTGIPGGLAVSYVNHALVFHTLQSKEQVTGFSELSHGTFLS